MPRALSVCFSMPDAMSGTKLVGRLLCRASSFMNCCIHSLVHHLGMTHRQEASSAILFVQQIYTPIFFSCFLIHSLILESLRSIIRLCTWWVKNSRRFESSCAATILPINSYRFSSYIQWSMRMWKKRRGTIKYWLISCHRWGVIRVESGINAAGLCMWLEQGSNQGSY
jgi:hypothetical protein